MIFTTTKKKEEKRELYPGIAVLIQYGNVFRLNEEAMRQFGYQSGLALNNFVTNGFDDNNNLVLANIKMDGTYTNNITAKDTFSSVKFAERLKSQFNKSDNTVFELEIFEDGGIKFGRIMGELLYDNTEDEAKDGTGEYITTVLPEETTEVKFEVEEDPFEEERIPVMGKPSFNQSW